MIWVNYPWWHTFNCWWRINLLTLGQVCVAFILAITTAKEQNRIGYHGWTVKLFVRQTFFTHQDLCTTAQSCLSGNNNNNGVKPACNHLLSSIYTPLTMHRRKVIAGDWIYTAKYSCSTTATTDVTNHWCPVCDSVDHPVLHCAKRRFLIPTVDTLLALWIPLKADFPRNGLANCEINLAL